MVEAGKIRVLIADDSAFMRLLLGDMLQDVSIEVVASVADGRQAAEQAELLRPDVVLLDLVMPEYDGVSATREIMARTPCPILILTAQDIASNALWEAMEAGAADFMLKPAGMLNSKMREQGNFLIEKLKQLAYRPSLEGVFLPTPARSKARTPSHIIAIGASTGGTSVIEYLLSRLPQSFSTPIVIAQHIPPSFAQSFAKRLQETRDLPIRLAVEGVEVSEGNIYILPADGNMVLQKEGKEIFFAYTQELFPAYNAPSIDALFRSVAALYAARATAMLLTGMGSDGAQGMEEIYAAGGFTIAQSQESCVVFGMPREAIKRGAVCEVLSPEKMAQYLV